MTSMLATLDGAEPTRRLTAEKIGHALVALIFLTSFYVKIEPAVCDIMFFLALIAFYKNGLSIVPNLAPLFLFLLVYNVAGFTSFILVTNEVRASFQYVIVSFYMSTSGFFIAAYIAHDPVQRFNHIMKYYYFGATIAALLGLMGYFHVGPIAEYFIRYERAVSGFKDPNVFSTYLILPAVIMLQSLLLGKKTYSLFNMASLLLILMAIFLAFSRGAWINFVISSFIMFSFTLMFASKGKQRAGLVWKGIAVIVVMAITLTILLSIPDIRDLFLDRFTLVKNYDAGEFGRFGNQRNAVPMLMLKPFGFGPLQFDAIFSEAPHNTFLNAFSSFGWLGGVTYFTLIIMTLFVGLRMCLSRSPFQISAIGVFACMAAMTFQGVQIDTEHWRHFYWLLGMVWGFFATSQIGESDCDFKSDSIA
jgi:hypothetical protein